MAHKATEIETHRPATLLLTFDNGEKKIFNMTELMELKPWSALANDYELFSEAHLDNAGDDVVWTGDIDLATETVWEEGKILD